MREHTHLPAMMSFVREHVAQHFQANWPRRSPTVATKRSDAASTLAKRFIEHLRAAGGTLGQPGARLLRRAVRPVKLCWNLQMRSGKPDPLAANIVHVREDCRNAAECAGRFGSPGCRVKMFDKNLVQAIVSGKDLACGPAELSVNAFVTRRHGSLLPLYVTTKVTPVSDMCLSVDQHVSVRRFFIITSPCASARVRF